MVHLVSQWRRQVPATISGANLARFDRILAGLITAASRRHSFWPGVSIYLTYRLQAS